MHSKWITLGLLVWINQQYNVVQVEAFTQTSITRHRQSLMSPISKYRVRTCNSILHASSSTTGGAKKKAKKAKKKSKTKKFSKNLNAAKAINRELISSSTAQEILDIFVSKGGAKGFAGGDVFNSVNFSTCLHRLARFATQNDNYKHNNNKGGNRQNRNTNGNKGMSVDEKRKKVLSDPRSAILFASLAEAIVEPSSNEALTFNNRELANLAWAIAKLKVAPPSHIYPISRSIELIEKNKLKQELQNKGPDTVSVERKALTKDVLSTASKVRKEVLDVAKIRSSMSSAAERAAVKNKWIPTLSQLSAKLLDVIALQVLDQLDEFNSQELANLLYAFANAGRADHILFEALSEQLVKRLEDKSKFTSKDKKQRPKPQEFSNSVWAFASAGLRNEGQIKLIEAVADVLDYNDGAILKEFKPQELSNTAWGVATLLSRRNNGNADLNEREEQAAIRILRWVAKSLEERTDDFKSQEISNSVWAFATVGFGAATSSTQSNTNNEYIYLKTDDEEGDRNLVKGTLSAVINSALKRLPRFRPQELNNLTWGICRLGHYEEKMDTLFEGVGQELLKRHYYFKPQDIGTTLWSFATFGYFDEEVFRAAASELSLKRSHSFKPQELSNTVWALATAGAPVQYNTAFDTTIIPQSKRPSLPQIKSDPITLCFAAATTELMRRPENFKAQEIKDVLWSLSKAGIRHPGVFRSVAEHLVGSDADASMGKTGRGLEGFSPQGIGNLAWAFAKQAQLAADSNHSTIGSTGRLAVYETSCLDVGEQLIRRLFLRIAETGFTNMNRFKPQDISNSCWAFATLGLLHNSYFNFVSEHVKLRLASPKPICPGASTKWKAQEISNLIWAFATLNVESNDLIESFTPHIIRLCSLGKPSYSVESIAQSIKRQEAANLAWSCAVLQEYPKELMPLLYTAMFGEDSTDPKYLQQVYDDDGVQKQSVMTMFYVQMALQMEAPSLGLKLPPNFPIGWQEGDSISKMKKMTANEVDNSMLQLTTSKLQQKVSQTLNSIGFDHKVEHVISTDDLEKDCGVYLSSVNQEFLSLDIANLEQKIGIEVDGPGHFVNVIDRSNDNTSNEIGGEISTGNGKRGWEFTANGSQQVNGPTALKHRLMLLLGWKIAHIPYFEWRQNEDTEEYCRNLLKEL